MILVFVNMHSAREYSQCLWICSRMSRAYL